MSHSTIDSKRDRPQAGLRREGREAAIQYLFQLDFQSLEETAPDSNFWKLRNASEDPDALNPMPVRSPIPPKARAFAESLIQGVCAHRTQLDELIVKFAKNYQLTRLAAVDRNILRLAIFELLHNPEVPPVVAINEAIELAKQFGSEDSGRFVNGLLDRVRAEIPRPPRQRQSPAPSDPTALVTHAAPATDSL